MTIKEKMERYETQTELDRLMAKRDATEIALDAVREYAHKLGQTNSYSNKDITRFNATHEVLDALIKMHADACTAYEQYAHSIAKRAKNPLTDK